MQITVYSYFILIIKWSRTSFQALKQKSKNKLEAFLIDVLVSDQISV